MKATLNSYARCKQRMRPHAPATCWDSNYLCSGVSGSVPEGTIYPASLPLEQASDGAFKVVRAFFSAFCGRLPAVVVMPAHEKEG